MNAGTIIIAVIVFGALIFFHELGHFATAKLTGVRVNEFALGMGPAIFKFTKGETRYALRLFPLGGYCAFEGDDEESSDPRAFCNAQLWRRILIIVAGSLMNLLLGLILLGFLTTQQQSLGSTIVAGFHENSTSSRYLMEGDEILRVNNHRVYSDNDLVYEFMRDRDGVMEMQVLRGGEKLTLPNVTFQMRDVGDGAQAIFIDFKVRAVPKTVMGVVANSFNWTNSIVKQVWGSFIDLITGRYGINQLSGPVGVTSAIGQASSMGLRSLLLLVAFITVNLGVFNLLPLPALDGGRLIFLLIELVRRKPVSPKYEGLVHAVGFILLIGIMIIVTVNDVVRLV